MMDNTREILKKIRIGLDVATYLLNTHRGMQATHLCNECLILLNKLGFDINGLNVFEVIVNSYYASTGYTNAVRYTNKFITMFHNIGKLMIEVGDKYLRRSRLAEAKELFKGAVAIRKSIGYRIGPAMTYGRLGLVFESLSKYPQKAKEYHEEALAIAIEIGNRREEGALELCFNHLVNIRRLKKITRKLLQLEKILVTGREKERAMGTLELCFNHLVNIRRLKNITRKLLQLEQILVTGKEKERAMGTLELCFNLSKTKEYLERALAIATEIGHREGEGTYYGNLGAVFQSLAEYRKAKEYHEKALAIAKEIGDWEGHGTRYGNLGVVFQSLGEYQRAKKYHEKAFAVATEIGDRKGERTRYGNLGVVFQSLGEYQKAKEYHKKALAIAIEIGDKKKEGTCYTNLGAVFLSLYKNKRAKEHFDKALAISIEIGD
ncbi:Tetratricopeptide repeat protein 28 [Stylophora pistillata]|uniref:Tetratricopeptide repeat protein 28 n=1 Tax=Stylophora pistillata TaxID=50429 RepID=A0A2B4R3K7_STYPI|nr:Tetratricopeptide repeat protein 28 [Stylophora pistillata]